MLSPSRQDAEDPAEPVRGAGALVRAAALSLLPGLIAFVLDQAYNVTSQSIALPAISAFSYGLIFLAAGMAGLAFTRLLGRGRGESAGLRRALLVGIAYAAVISILPPAFALLGRVGWAKIGKREAVSVLGLALLVLFHRYGREGFRRRLPWVLGLLSLVVLWSLFGPEPLVLGERGQVIGAAFFVAVLLGIAQRVRLGLRLPIAADLAALAAMVLAVVLLQASSESRLYRRSRTGTATGATTATHAPNIVFIVWDTVRRDHLSLYGYGKPTTPYLESRARESRVFTQATSVAPWTLPSHASMFTGLYPRSHGADFVVPPGDTNLTYRRLNPASLTLAKALTDHGYECGAVSANYGFVARKVGMDVGFGYFNDQYNPWYLTRSRLGLQSGLIALKPWMPQDLLFRMFTPYMTADQVNATALRWIDSLQRRRPFFLFLNFLDAHFPHYPPRRLLERFPAPAVELDQERLLREMHLSKRPLREDERSYLNSLYDAKIFYLDEQLKAFEDELRKRKLFDDALIVLVSDHGEFLGEHDLLGHALDVYGEVLNIPLLIKYPRGAQAGSDPSPVENRALFRRILAEAGVEIPADTVPWDAFAERTVAGSVPPPTPGNALLFRTRRAVFFDSYKFIASSDGNDELYSLADDPREAHNLVRDEPQRAEKGRQLVDQFLNSVPRPAVEEGVHILSPEEAERLRAVGYVQ